MRLRSPITLLLLLASLLPAAGAVAGEEGGPCGASPQHAGGDWPSYSHDTHNSRTQPMESVLSTENVGDLQQVWSFDADDHAGGVLNTTPIVAGGCVYVVPSSGEVHALNADTGEPVWAAQLEAVPQGYGGGVVGAPAVAADRLVVVINRGGSPYLAALDITDGAVLWSTVMDETETAITNASVTVFDGMALIGFSGSSGGEPRERGGYVIVDVADGALLAKSFTISDEDFEAGFGGASIWSTAAVDEASRYAYVGTGNPHSDKLEHERTNSIIKIDLDRERGTFGQIVGQYKGRADTYIDGLDQLPTCQMLPPIYYFATFDATCTELDLDFGASPNLFADADGRLLVGALQKAGVYHAVDTETMEQAWEHVGGVPCFSCNAATAAFDGERIHYSASPPGQLWSVDRSNGSVGWARFMAGGLHYYSVSHANGVVYSTDTYGFLNAFDAESGEQLLKLPMGFSYTGPNAGSLGVAGSTGVAIARNTVYAAVGSRVFAYGLDGAGGEPPPQPPGPPGAGGGSVIAAGPGAQFAGYATPAMVVDVGGELTFANGDAASHDVVAVDAVGPDDQPWCGNAPPGKCPLFWSKLIGVGGQTPVLGTENLESGESYEFFCTLHTNMRGTLVAQ